MKTKCFSLHDIITVKSNMKTGLPDRFQRWHEPEVDLSYMREDFDFRPVEDEYQSRGKDFFYWKEPPKKLILNYKAPLLNTKLMIDGFDGQTNIKLTKDLTNWGRAGIGFKSLLQLKLLQKDAMFIHAGSVKTDDGVVLVVATKDSGKTSTVA